MGRESRTREQRGDTITVEWFHFCEYSFITMQGRPGVIGIHEGILIGKFPAPVPISFAVFLRTTPHRVVEATAEILRDGKVQAKLNGRFTADDFGGVLFQAALGLLVKTEGSFDVRVNVEGQDLVSRSIPIRLRPGPQTDASKVH